MKEQAIEMIAEIIAGESVYGCPECGANFVTNSPDYVAQRILDLYYPCAECKGKGEVPQYDQYTDNQICFMKCPTCKGTGKGSKVLAILDPDQTLPVNPYLGDIDIFNNIRLATRQGYDKAQQDMITPKDGKVWRKTVT